MQTKEIICGDHHRREDDVVKQRPRDDGISAATLKCAQCHLLQATR